MVIRSGNGDGSTFDELRRIWDFEGIVAAGLVTIRGELAAIEPAPAYRASLERAVRAADDIQEALRTLSTLSRGTILSGKTLDGAISARLRRIEAEGPATTFSVVGDPVPLDRMTVHDLLMVFHEAVENVLQHAQAGSLRVGLVYAGPVVMLLVEDDGRGYDTGSSTAERGIRRMKERMIEQAGTLSISSVPGWGTALRVTMAADPVRRAARERTSVAVADPRAVVVAGLAALAARADAQVAVVGEFTSAADAIRAVALSRPSIIILGMGFGDDTPSIIESLHDASPESQIIAVANSMTTTRLLTEAQKSGITAVVDAHANVDEVIDTILSVALGRSVRQAWQTARPDLQGPAVVLTGREREIRRLLLEGSTNQAIADELGLSVRTVEKHVSAVLHKIGVRNRVELLSGNRDPSAPL